MGLFDWLFRGPTLKDVAGRVVQSLQRRGAQDIQVNLEMSEIVASVHGSPVRIYLGNLHADYQRSPRAERAPLVERFLDSIAAPGTDIPASYEDAKPKLMPVVRNITDIGVAALTAQRHPPTEKPYSPPAHRPLAADVVIGLVCDMPTAMAFVTAQQLADWGVGFDEALEQALLNLRDLPEAAGWNELGPGVWLGEWGDSYDSSRLLLPDLIHRLGVPEPVALVPFRNALFVTSARNTAGLLMAAQVIDKVLANNPRWLSFEPLRLQAGPDGQQHWVPHELPPELQDAFRTLNERNREGAYASQKRLLDDLHETGKTDVFVASYQLMQREGGPLRSMAVWTKGVDTLLPQAELVAFVIPGEGDDPVHWLVAWQDVQEIAAPLLEKADMEPARWRARAFPDEGMVALLRDREAQV